MTRTQLLYTSVNPAFEALATQILDVYATDADGFPDDFNTAMLALQDDEPFPSSLDDHVANMDFEDGAVQKAYFDPITLDAASFNDDGDKILGDYEGYVGAAGNPSGDPPAPSPPDPAPPPDTGGGGGGDTGTPTGPPGGKPGPAPLE